MKYDAMDGIGSMHRRSEKSCYRACQGDNLSETKALMGE
jgi:hypothetical protein